MVSCPGILPEKVRAGARFSALLPQRRAWHDLFSQRGILPARPFHRILQNAHEPHRKGHALGKRHRGHAAAAAGDAFWLGGAVRCFVSPFPGGISRRCAAVSPGGDSRRPSADGTHAFLLCSRPDGGVLAYLFSRARPPFPRMAPWLAPVWSSGCAVGAAAALPLDVPLCRRK